MRVLLVYPETPDTFWSFKHVMRLVVSQARFPPLGLLTVAALLPRDWKLRLVDLNVEPLTDADIAGPTTSCQRHARPEASVAAIVDRCVALREAGDRRRAPLHDGRAAFPRMKYFVPGEAEDVLPELVADMRAGACGRATRRRGAPTSRASLPALGPRRPPRLRHDVDPVLAGLSLRLRVLRHHGDERTRAARQVPGQ